MKYVVKLYDQWGLMFAHKTFDREYEAKDYGSRFNLAKTVIERVNQ